MTRQGKSQVTSPRNEKSLGTNRAGLFSSNIPSSWTKDATSIQQESKMSKHEDTTTALLSQRTAHRTNVFSQGNSPKRRNIQAFNTESHYSSSLRKKHLDASDCKIETNQLNLKEKLAKVQASIQTRQPQKSQANHMPSSSARIN